MYPAYDYILLILLYFSTYHPFIHVVALVCVFDDRMVVVQPLGPHVIGVVQLPNGRLCSNCPQRGDRWDCRSSSATARPVVIILLTNCHYNVMSASPWCWAPLPSGRLRGRWPSGPSQWPCPRSARPWLPTGWSPWQTWAGHTIPGRTRWCARRCYDHIL